MPETKITKEEMLKEFEWLIQDSKQWRMNFGSREKDLRREAIRKLIESSGEKTRTVDESIQREKRLRNHNGSRTFHRGPGD